MRTGGRWAALAIAAALGLAGCGAVATTVPSSAGMVGTTVGAGGTPAMRTTVAPMASATVVARSTFPPTAIPSGTIVYPASGPWPTSAPAPGSPAIRPSRASTGPDDPAFTEQDARDYALDHGGAYIVGPWTVTSVRFFRGAELGYGDNPLVCLVNLGGEAYLPLPPGRAPTPRPRTPVAGSFLLFDAHTGNLVSDGVPAWGTPTR